MKETFYEAKQRAIHEVDRCIEWAYACGYEDGRRVHEEVRQKDYDAGFKDGKEIMLNELKTIKIKMPDYPCEDCVKHCKVPERDCTGFKGYEGQQKGFEKCSECKYKDADLCKTKPLHEEDEKGNCINFVPEEPMPKEKWRIVKPGWIMIPKCTTCKYLKSPIVPCERCRDNSEFEPAPLEKVNCERQTEKSCESCKYLDSNNCCSSEKPCGNFDWNSYEPKEERQTETEEINILKTIDDNVGCDNCPLGYDDDECEFVTECPITKAIDKAVDAIKQMRGDENA